VLTLYKFLKFLFRHAVPGSMRYSLVRVLARLIYFFDTSRRKTILSNLTPLVGAERARSLGPSLLGSFAMNSVDFFCPKRDLITRIKSENAFIVEKTWRKHKKVIVVTAHLGNWELGMSYLLSRGFSMAGLYAPYREDDVVEWIMGHRNSEVEWIPVAKGAAEACLSALERGRILGILADIPFGEKGRRVQIAGHHVRLPLGPWAIAVRAKAAVIPGFVLREKPGQYRIVFHEPLDSIEGSFRKQMEHLQEAYRKRLESYLKAYPDQWGVLQRFWEHA
jgi:Kdo2-lipid IVA lauroyltransferase/acyltransferase